MSKNAKYVVSREIWKKIRKLDHAKFDEWVRAFVKNIDEDNNKVHSKTFEEFDKINNMAIMQALENTKGIGEKIRGNFIENYNKALKDNIKNNDFIENSENKEKRKC
ncbi:hypothetical protein HMPREF1143_0194 [Peptoanaerobacter stomatis]|uniref:Uncharacterized protein n=1 Tax=Peptoanaerobacter stomatis TaxID=796937 RepID=J5WEU3_9FIRM|nr:hypothetical protein [Peptoanaerobacter stomatis]EJU21447.1 hypothetical protein HMPREF1143_0194 [Peptoanaerobacter stomatis]